MPRSKLEMYIDILRTLSLYGPLVKTHIMYEVNINSTVMRQYLTFLIKQNLIEEHKTGKKRVVFQITELGMAILRQFRELVTVVSGV